MSKDSLGFSYGDLDLPSGLAISVPWWGNENRMGNWETQRHGSNHDLRWNGANVLKRLRSVLEAYWGNLGALLGA